MKLNDEYYSFQIDLLDNLKAGLLIDNGNAGYSVNKDLDVSASYGYCGKYSPYNNITGRVYGGQVVNGIGENVTNVTPTALECKVTGDEKLPLFLFLNNPNDLGKNEGSIVQSMSSFGDVGFPRIAGSLSVRMSEYVPTHIFRTGDSENPRTATCECMNWGDNNNGNITGYYGRVITQFQYNALCLYVSVWAQKSALNVTEYYEGGLDGWNELDYPWLKRVNITVCYGSKTKRTAYENIVVGCAISNKSVPFYHNKIEGDVEHMLLPGATYRFTYDVESTPVGRAFGGSNQILGEDFLYNVREPYDFIGDDSGYGVVHWQNEQLFDKAYSTNFAWGLPEYTYGPYAVKKDDIARMVSSLGLYWSGDLDSARNSVLGKDADDSKIRLPKQTNDTFEGDYTSGSDIGTQPNAEWGGDGSNPYDWYKSNGVKYTSDNDDNTDSEVTDTTPLNTPSVSTLGKFNRTFILKGNDVKKLSKFLWNNDKDIFDEIVDNLKLMGGNPIDALIDLRLYPLDISKKINSLSTIPIMVGRNNTNVDGISVTKIDQTVNLGSITITNVFNNFLDYAPYTSYLLYIPYVGTLDLSPEIYGGSKINVKLVIDYSTGSCSAIIFKNNVITQIISSTIGVSIPLSSNISSDWSNSILNSCINGVAGSVGNLASGNVGSAVTSMVNSMGDVTSQLHAEPIQTSGTASPNVSIYAPQYCYLLISRPIVNEPTTYASTIGYACCFNSHLKSLNGFTVCDNVNITISGATNQECEKIQTLLKNGVYL
ncbi:MAG: hypothetical protein IJ371_01260 [Clostridia bacterium]|nr:hypothetical protein [Clostridia bacterium]